jgi:hypothetical protein
MASRSSESFSLLSSKELAIPKTKIRKLKDKEEKERKYSDTFTISLEAIRLLERLPQSSQGIIFLLL